MAASRDGSVLVMSTDQDDGDRRDVPALRPTDPQRRYLERGLSQPGGKLPLFDSEGRAVAPRTIQACVANGWAEPWFSNPIKPDWLVCRLTEAGRKALGRTDEPPAAATPGKAARPPKGRKGRP
jgi:hypothetical protein